MLPSPVLRPAAAATEPDHDDGNEEHEEDDEDEIGPLARPSALIEPEERQLERFRDFELLVKQIGTHIVCMACDYCVRSLTDKGNDWRNTIMLAKPKAWSSVLINRMESLSAYISLVNWNRNEWMGQDRWIKLYNVLVARACRVVRETIQGEFRPRLPEGGTDADSKMASAISFGTFCAFLDTACQGFQYHPDVSDHCLREDVFALLDKWRIVGGPEVPVVLPRLFGREVKGCHHEENTGHSFAVRYFANLVDKAGLRDRRVVDFWTLAKAAYGESQVNIIRAVPWLAEMLTTMATPEFGNFPLILSRLYQAAPAIAVLAERVAESERKTLGWKTMIIIPANR